MHMYIAHAVISHNVKMCWIYWVHYILYIKWLYIYIIIPYKLGTVYHIPCMHIVMSLQIDPPTGSIAQVHEWEKKGRPDPVSDDMVHYCNVLRASHDAAVAEVKSEPSPAS